MPDATSRELPVLSAVVVHWHGEAELGRLIDAWPIRDPRVEMVVVDNSGTADALPSTIRRLEPEANLGFGGGVDAGAEVARGRWLLMLNPDARPDAGAIDSLLDAIERSDATGPAGLVPALTGPDGRSQHRWQLRPLPRPFHLALQGLRFVGVHGPRRPPAAGTPIAQPAAAALAIRRDVFLDIGGFDPRFFPAWFEDVDLARRLADAGHELCYVPGARFVHDGAASVPALGFGRFLWLYYRHLVRYLDKHHGPAWSRLGRVVIGVGMLLRLLAVPFRRPRQARSRVDAVRAFWLAARGAWSGWRRPRSMARAFRGEGGNPVAREGTP